MLNLIAKYLRGLAEWLSPTPPPPVKETHHHEDHASKLVLEAEKKWPEASGEYKRHQVYSQLLKAFPMASKRDLAYAIELAIQRW